VAVARNAQRDVGRGPLERGVSRRLAESRYVRGAFVGFDLVDGDCPLQGAFSATSTDAPLDEETAASIADPTDDPETVLLKKNRGELLRRSLASLSPEHGEVIDLVYYHEKSVKETAEIVGVAEATVKTRMFYARKKLADLVDTAA
jgi:RNA polymerase sigma factor (sigma-70 family)